MNKYFIQHTTEKDWPVIHQLVDNAIEFTRKNNYPVFPGHNKQPFKKDMEWKRQYKVVDTANNILAIFSICDKDELLWRQKEKGDAIYLHRIVSNVNMKWPRQFPKLLAWAIVHAKQKGKQFVRMDTWANNPKIIDYYSSFGFSLIEVYTTPDSEDFLPTHRNLSLALLQKNIF